MKKIICALLLLKTISIDCANATESFMYDTALDRSTFPIKKGKTNKGRFFSILTTQFGTFDLRDKNTGMSFENPGSFGGCLAKIQYDFGPWWLQLKLGMAKQINNHKSAEQSIYSDFELDDVLLSAGRSFKIGKDSRLAFSGIVGFPATSKTHIGHVGTGQYSASVNIEASLPYCTGRSSKHSIIAEMQIIYYFFRNHHFNNNREATDFENFLNIPKVSKTQFNPLIGNCSQWGNHRLEVAYNPTVTIESHDNNSRTWEQVIYANYNYIFFIRKNIGGAVGLGLYYSSMTSRRGHEEKIKTIGLYTNLSFTF